MERHAAREVFRHHHHAGDPEEDDVVAGHENGGGEVEIVGDLVVTLRVRPAKGGERHHGGREPGIEHVGVLAQLHAFSRLFLSLGFGLSDIAVARFVVPGRNLVAPEELTREAPVLDVREPVAVNALPLFREDVHITRFHRFKTDISEALARMGGAFARGLAHRHVPLLGKHRLNDFTGTRHARHHVADRLRADEKALLLKVLQHGLAGFVAVHADILRRRVFVDLRVLRENRDAAQIVTAADLKVVEVVSRGDLYAAGTEFAVHVGVRDNRNLTVAERQVNRVADEILVAFVLRVHGDRFVAEQRLRTGRRDDNVLSAIGCRVTDFPEMSVFLFRLHFDVRHRGLQLRIPVHETGALVDQALAVQLDEGLPDNARKLFIHREVGALPIHGVTEAAHLLQNRAAGEFLPLEHFLHELFAGEGVGIDSLLFELALNHDLSRNTGVIGAREPERVVARHAVIAGERIHDGLIERMPHVQDARNVGRRELDREAWFVLIESGAEVAALFPFRVPVRFNGSGFEALGELCHQRSSHFKGALTYEYIK